MPKDKADVPYTAPTKAPATPGTKVTIHTQNGPVKGTMLGGGYVTPDKKK